MDKNISEKVYQMFILGLDEDYLPQGSNLEKALNKGLGGVILFTKNIESIEQTKKLNDDIRAKATIPPFLSIDQEGGRVERTENIFGGKKFLSAKFAAEKGEDFLIEQTEQISRLLKSMGFNLNFAPCLDVNSNPNNPIIGERAFSDSADNVIKFGKIVAKTYEKEGIIPCTKHFPGHGDASVDSHIALPKIDLGFEEMEKVHIRPFKEVICPMIMVAHLHCTMFDKQEIPSSLSKNVIDYLNNKLEYKGLIITDDMVMGGVSGRNATEAAIKAINAGINILLYRDSKTQTINIIDKIIEKAQNDTELRKKIENSYKKIIFFKKAFLNLCKLM